MTATTVYGTSAIHVLCEEEPSEQLALGRVELTIGGPAAVVGFQLALLGHPARFVGTVGADSAGEFVLSELQRVGVDCSAVMTEGRTPRVVAAAGGGDVRLTADVTGANVPPPRRWLAADPTDGIGYATGFPDMVPVIQALGVLGHRLVVDLGYIPLLSQPEKLLAHTRSIAPAIGVAVVNGAPLGARDRAALVDTCLAGGASTVLVTLGEDGVAVTTSGFHEHLPAFRVTATDSLCAGDAFVAGYLCGTLEGQDPLAAAAFGQAVAASKVSLFGGFPRRSDVDSFLARQRVAP
jgi:sugar/nucleoside kinase (ribokinase family)